MDEKSDRSSESEETKITSSIVSDEIPITNDEDIDTDFIIEVEDVQINKLNISLNTSDLCLLILEKSDKFKDYIGEVIEVEDNYIILNDELEQKIRLNLEDGELLLKLDDGTNIIDALNIKEVNPEDVLKEEDVFKEDEIKLDLEVVEKQFKVYNETEIKEDFISEIINLYQIYDNELLIKKINEMAYTFFDLIKENKSISDIDKTDVLKFIKSFVNNNEFNLPNYILPIVAIKKKLYILGEEETNIDEPNSVTVNFNEEIVEKYNYINAEGNGYIKKLDALFSEKYKPYINNLDKNGFIINYEGNLVTDQTTELLKTTNEIFSLSFPEKKIYKKSEELNVVGLLFLPNNLINYSLKLQLNNNLNLYENILLCDRIYSIKSFNKSFSENDMNTKNINLETLKEVYKNELTSYLFDIDDNITIQNLSELLKNVLPNNKSIIDSIDKNILKFVFNFQDLENILLIYDININDLSSDDKNEIIELINSNIKNYEKNYKKLLKSVIKPLKKVKYITKELDTSDKIKLCREYILRNTNIIERNHLLNKFIKVYCRESKNLSENTNWLYSKKTNEQILCKHYLYSCKIDKHPEYYDSLKSLFCPQSEDGHISCINCGHLIDNVDFSTFQGFSDGKVINTTELLEEQKELSLTEGNVELKKYIEKVLKKFNIKLFPNDLENIIETYLSFDSNKFTDFKYNKLNYINNFTKKLVIKNKNGENDEKLKKQFIKNFKIYNNNLNKLLSITFLIFIYIQISNNVYRINVSELFNILNYDKEESWKQIPLSDDYSSINMRVVEYIKTKIKGFLKANLKFITQKEFIKDDFNRDFINIIKYLLQPQFNLYDKINRYFILNKNNENLFTKESWPTYKPIYDNKLVLNINKYISSKDEEMKQYFINNDSLENISLLKDINKIEPKYIEYKLPVSTLIGNPSYKRLYVYSLKLHGRSEVFPILNLLGKKFLEDINNDKINDLLAKCNFKNNEFSKINYNDMKNIIIGEITKYEIENSKDYDNIVKFKTINLNNTEYLLLNGEIIKHYKYIPAEIFNNSNYEELITNNKEFIEKLFKNYCLNSQDELIINNIDENILNYYLVDYGVELLENIPECKRVNIPYSEENFNRIMEYLPNKNKMPLNIYIPYTEKYTNDDIFIFLNFNTNIEKRLLNFFENKEYLNDDVFNEIFKVITDVKTIKDNRNTYKEDDIFNKLDDISVIINDTIVNKFNNIDQLYEKIIVDENYNYHFIGDNLQLKRLKSIPITGLNNVENTSKILEKLIEDINDSYIYKRLIDDIYYSISCIKNNKNTYRIRKNTFKLSDNNVDNFNEFILINNFLLHNDLFFKRNKKELDDGLKYKGFKQYFHENNSIYFEELYNYISKFKCDINKLKGLSNNVFNSDLLLKINKYLFVFIIEKISEFINILIDDDSDINDIVTQKLEEKNIEEINKNNCIICLSKFLLDIIINIYEKYYDTNWVYISEELLNKSIMKQVSREKQTYLKKTTQMTKEQKYQNDLMNDMGKGTLYKESEKENIKFSESEEWEIMTANERIEMQKEIHMSSDDNITDQTYKPLESVEEDTGYEYNLGEGDAFDDGIDNDNDYD
jgi:hypothetical protein